ncbi:hypothetical protein NDU88_004214 [Pleurodeles waltl]|uniref:Uncharacterized protein n=1 Tax=Pleurodeles waltl TaxID=8319 RepID=A0AAV7T936_PLEWA|nr:hypothetical protein NDU88_004214 [Pleurodeles waltl]
MAEEKVRQALALLEQAGRMDLVQPEAFGPGQPVRRASTGVAAAVLACSPPRTAQPMSLVRMGGRAAGGTGKRGAAWAGQGAAGRGAAWGSAEGNPYKVGHARHQILDEGAARRNLRGAACSARFQGVGEPRAARKKRRQFVDKHSTMPHQRLLVGRG